MSADDESNNVIEIRDAYKRFSHNHVVFQGLSMTVKKGTIYGLLGPSSCGKTTLLNCITGISRLDSGTISVSFSDRTLMGYMPQGVALMDRFKVSEVIKYFGQIYGICGDAIVKRMDELLLLVDLPSNQYSHRSIASLSGGQLRRISLIVALLHDPQLLILDEPTVGLDSITRFSLWQHLVKEAEEHHKTILITTHYIEEARQSHTIGMMREGVLLAEASPIRLLDDYQYSNLEDVFLQLCYNKNETSVHNKPYPKKHPPTPPFSTRNCNCSLRRTAAQTLKNYYWVKRNLGMIAFIVVLPMVVTSLICMIRSDNLKGLRVATVSEEFCANFTTDSLPSCNQDAKLSCLYMEILKNKGYIVTEFLDMASGYKALTHGHSMALLYFSSNYTQCLIDFLSSSIYNPPEAVTLNCCQVEVTLDTTDLLKVAQLRQDLNVVYNDVRREILQSCGFNPRTAERPLVIKNAVYGELQQDFTRNALPGFLLPFVFYLASTFTSASVVAEKSSGVFQRSLISGVTTLEVYLAHSVIQVVVLIVQNCLVMLMLYLVVDTIQGSVLTALLFVFISEFQGMLFGFLLSSLIKDERNLTYTGIGVVMTLFITSGMVWPIQGMEPVLKYIVQFSPWAWGVEAYRSICIRGWGLNQPSVFSALIYNLNMLIILFIANIVSSRLCSVG